MLCFPFFIKLNYLCNNNNNDNVKKKKYTLFLLWVFFFSLQLILNHLLVT